MRILPLVAILACACAGAPSDDAGSTGSASASSILSGALTEPAPAAPPAPVPAQLPEVLARVNGEPITRVEFERAVQSLEQRAGAPVPPDQRDQILRGVLDQIIGYKLLIQESAARKVVVPNGDIEARVNEIRSQFPAEGDFERMLAERQLTLERVRTDTRNDLAVERLIEGEIASRVAVSSEQVTAFYANNPDQFQQAESVRAGHILIGMPRDADTATKAAARTKAEQVLRDLRAGKDFAEMARQHSSDPGSAGNGGDLGVFQQGQMVGPFNDAAFSLAPGAMSDVVETEFGFHIIRVAEKQPARVIPLDEVRPQLEEYLEQVNRQQETDTFVNGLKAKGTVEILI